MDYELMKSDIQFICVCVSLFFIWPLLVIAAPIYGAFLVFGWLKENL